MELMASAGIDHPDKVDRSVVSMRIDRTQIKTFEETYPELKIGSLLDGSKVPNDMFKFWKRATAESF